MSRNDDSREDEKNTSWKNYIRAHRDRNYCIPPHKPSQHPLTTQHNLDKNLQPATMQFFIQSTLLAAMFATATLAQPTGSDSVSAAASDLITVCKDTNFNNCKNFSGEVNKCYDLPSEWNDVASSVRAWPGRWCYIYKDFACGGFRGGPIQDDNAHSDLGRTGWSDWTSSYMCFNK
ncbi:unnamed protein product [Periconia digitata]|uniref:Uncharacterized protein n=1 Tax=Periconia digitata TaxID=1303443 RepID=A0A9W4XI51_9PLEO|nr:unnamed protein product [Periconia digitata]